MKKLFDETVFDTLRSELGEADTAEVLKAFLADTAGKMARLAVNTEAGPLIRREAHAIKSSAATFGFDDLSRLARELEFGAETVTSAKLRESVRELQLAFEMTRQYALANLLDTGLGVAS
jgi:HPt (histidine-containing phosphotransfer) domain-containing protein